MIYKYMEVINSDPNLIVIRSPNDCIKIDLYPKPYLDNHLSGCNAVMQLQKNYPDDTTHLVKILKNERATLPITLDTLDIMPIINKNASPRRISRLSDNSINITQMINHSNKYMSLQQKFM